MRFILPLLMLVLLGGLAQAGPFPRPVSDTDYAPVDLDEARLGQLLFYDPILSGNRNIACATCHHPAFGTADGVPLAFGEGGIGLGPTRVVDPKNIPAERIPRNAPALFNLGAEEFTVLFHDGRVEVDPSLPGGIRTPMDADMLKGFASALSAQSMFPVLSQDEMAGEYRENFVGRAVRQGLITGKGGAWDILARRVAGLPVYVAQFEQVYPHIKGPDDIAFTDIANAIAVFMAHEWRSDTAPFDDFLRQRLHFNGAARRGLGLFYGGANCASCHSGPFLTDHAFHAVGVPQIGPGKAAGFQGHHRDEGRFGVTGDPADLYAFRTPSLRNIALTAPYGHAGAHAKLESFVRDHVDPVAGLEAFDTGSVHLPDFKGEDFVTMANAEDRHAIAGSVTLPRVTLNAENIADLVAFLNTLTDPVAVKGRLGVPLTVPSGLPVPMPD